MASTDYILEVKNIVKTYPGVRALDDVSLSVKRGEILAIAGENGAGKSTLIKTITGAHKPTSGKIYFEGVEYAGLDTYTAKKLGIQCTYQELNNFSGLTVMENIFLFDDLGSKKMFCDYKTMYKKTDELLKRLGVNIDPSERMGNLTVGLQQIVEIAKAIASGNLKLLIMDEPSAALTNAEVDTMMSLVHKMKSDGVTIIYISHRMDEIFELSDRCSVFCDGRHVATLITKETNRQELIRYMVGRTLEETFPVRETPIGEEVLRVEHLSGNGVNDINFSLGKGEILGFAGLLGSGRTETAQLIFGAAKATGGKIFLRGKEVKMRNTSYALKNGIGLIPEDRKRQGIFLRMSIRWNTVFSCLKGISKFLFVNRAQENTISEEYINRLRVKTPSDKQLVRNLSGGNQQKVVCAKVLATHANIIIFDEPTRGIDVGAKREMYLLMRELADQGQTIIMISSEMEEVLGMSDRIVVFHEGKQMGILNRDEFSQERILNLASGN